MSEWTDIGEQLRKARESKGLDLRDVAHSTRIPLPTLSALEDSDYSIFPSPTYARSFLSQYSEFLDVDANEWIDAFETGDVLANVKDYGYLTSDNGSIGEQRHNPEPAQRRGRIARRQNDSSASPKSSGGTSILQTLTVFFVTAVLIVGGIYTYKKFEPMLTGTQTEEATDAAADINDAGAQVPPAAPPTQPDSTPPLVAKNNPESTNYGGTIIPTTKKEPEKPALVKSERTGPPPKALVIEEDEE